jgi:hypothetical protein
MTVLLIVYLHKIKQTMMFYRQFNINLKITQCKVHSHHRREKTRTTAQRSQSREPMKNLKSLQEGNPVSKRVLRRKSQKPWTKKTTLKEKLGWMKMTKEKNLECLQTRIQRLNQDLKRSL